MFAEPDEWRVYGGQLLRWRQFREWQGKRRKEFKGRISEYTGWAKRFLNRHSFTAPFEFEFDEDPKRQDQLTTWIEYLTYEYNFYSQRYAWYKRRGKWYDAQWKKLVDSGVLRPQETYEFIMDVNSSFQHMRERTQAEGVVESAQSAVSSAQQALGLSQPSTSAQRRLAAAQSKLDLAMQSLESIKRRNGLVTEFYRTTQNYRDAKRGAERHTILLQWVRDQVPLIEAELEQSKVPGNVRHNSNAGVKRSRAGDVREEHDKGRQRHEERPSVSTRKRSRGDISLDDGSPLKRSRYDVHNSIGGSQEPGITAATKQDGHDKATSRTSVLSNARSTDASVNPQHPRRSARIAARQDPSGNAVAPLRAVNSTCPKPRQKVAQVPTPASSTRSQDGRQRGAVTKAPQGRGKKAGDRLGTKGISKRRRHR